MIQEPRWFSEMRKRAQARQARAAAVTGPTRSEVQTELEELARLAQKAAATSLEADELLVACEGRLRSARELQRLAKIADVASAKRLRERVAKARS